MNDEGKRFGTRRPMFVKVRADFKRIRLPGEDEQGTIGTWELVIFFSVLVLAALVLNPSNLPM